MCHVRTLTHCVIVKVKKSDIRRALILNPVAARELELAIHEFKQNPVCPIKGLSWQKMQILPEFHFS